MAAGTSPDTGSTEAGAAAAPDAPAETR
ncbi:DUF3017 domain-containing protein, partial [Streptomyces sp. SID2563]|nr:DUF3017 domain-containing protein [Streptomyces sp. SID2563]